MVDAAVLKSLVEAELSQLNDARVMAHIRGLLVEPRMVMRVFDYGSPGERFPCWSILDHDASNTGIAYCEQGFGPKTPWGLVFLTGQHMSMGSDAGWYPAFRDAYFESRAPADLNIWRVFKGVRFAYPFSYGDPISPEASWDETWRQVMRLREQDHQSFYNCSHTIDWPERPAADARV